MSDWIPIDIPPLGFGLNDRVLVYRPNSPYCKFGTTEIENLLNGYSKGISHYHEWHSYIFYVPYPAPPKITKLIDGDYLPNYNPNTKENELYVEQYWKKYAAEHNQRWLSKI